MSVLLAFAVTCLVGFGALVLYGAFAVLVAFRFIQMALIAGLVITAYQAVFNVVPLRWRDQMRAFMAGGPGQAGIIAAGLLLGLGSQVARPQDLYLVGLAVGAVSTFCTWKAKQAYGRALVDALRAGQPALFVEDETFGGIQRDAAAVAVVVAGTSDRDPLTRRTSVEILGQLAVPEATAALTAALGDPDGPVRANALQALARSRAVSARPAVVARLEDPESDVRRQAINALVDLDDDRVHVAMQVQRLLADSDPAVRAQAALAVFRGHPDPSAWTTLIGMVESRDPETRALAVETIGVQASRDASELRSPSSSESSVGLLVRSLGDEDALVRSTAAEALGRVGPAALEPVLRELAEPTREGGALLALEYLPVAEAAATIRDYARAQAARALHCMDLWQGLGESVSDERRLLLESLRDEAHRRGSSALRAVALLSDRLAMTLALQGLSSRDPSQRATALETLDTLGEHALVRPLIRVWESTGGTLVTDGSPAAAMRDADPWIRACAALAVGAAHDPTNRSTLAELASTDPDPLVRDTATSALSTRLPTGHAADQADGGKAMDTLPAVSLLERVVFLRRVPLFARLAPIEVKQVAAIAGERVYADGEVLSSQGEPGDQMYLIVTGEVRVTVKRSDGTVMEAVRRGVGEYVGEMAILTQEPRIATLTAVGSVRALTISQKAFERILRERPETGLTVIRELCARLKESETRNAVGTTPV